MSDKLLEVNIRHTLHTASGELPMEVDFALPQGKIMALTGPSGAGKTTLLKQIAGLQQPAEGNINYGNTTWLNAQTNFPPQQRNIGFVFQDYALFPNMSVEENMRFALPKNDPPAIIEELLDATGLTNLKSRKPNQLSGGQRQRVALARALVRKPDLILLDEPFSAVDPDMRIQLQELILKFHRQYQFTAIVVTHDKGEIFRLAEFVGLLENGKLTSFGKPADIFLKNQDTVGDLPIYAELLSYKQKENKIAAEVLVNGKIHSVTLPIEAKTNLYIGRKFLLHFTLENPQISWLD